jgi:putative ABC transport system substrate-binding protein
LVVSHDNWLLSSREYLLAAVNRHQLPTVYPHVAYAEDGGVATYAVDTTDIFRLAGVYAGRVLNGADPANLPVRLPPPHTLIINLATASAHGISIPLQLLVTADRIIE